MITIVTSSIVTSSIVTSNIVPYGLHPTIWQLCYVFGTAIMSQLVSILHKTHAME